MTVKKLDRTISLVGEAAYRDDVTVYSAVQLVCQGMSVETALATAVRCLVARNAELTKALVHAVSQREPEAVGRAGHLGQTLAGDVSGPEVED